MEGIECKTAAIAGHNIMIILGQLNNNIRYLSRMSKNVAMTATTGIASCYLGAFLHGI